MPIIREEKNMEQFGNLINVATPVVLCFYSENVEDSLKMTPVLKEVANTLKERVKVVKIDVNKNKTLCEALKINALPTVLIYNKLSLIWRGEGFQNSNTLQMELSKFL